MEEKNYIKEYYMNKEHDLKSLVDIDITDNTTIKRIRNEIKKLQNLIEEKSVELHSELELLHSKNYEPIDKRIVISYTNKGYNTIYFDLNLGTLIEDIDIESDTIYRVSNKRGQIEIIVGYSYELGCIITNNYNYNIGTKNDRISSKLIKQNIISFMEDKMLSKDIESNDVVENTTNWSNTQVLKDIKDNVFINTMFGINYVGEFDLKDLREKYLSNKSFEIIIKTSPTEIMDKLLEIREIEGAFPIHKILGVSLETYKKALDRNLISELFEYRDFVNGKNNEKYDINKTEKEWLDLIEEIKNYEEDLKFYNIDYSGGYRYYNCNGLLSLLIETFNYKMYGETECVLKKYYSFSKFVNYVVNETINQGYNRIVDFTTELRDYLTMCEHDNIKPTLYSSYLKQTHDITSRNHKVVVEKENEEIFKSRYEDFKEYKGKEYMVIAPKCSNDLKNEGDRLNHCVASYIKRVIDGECLIYFLRKDKEESLITMEIRHNDIVQVKGLHNRKPSQAEIKAIKEFAKYRNLGENF